MPTMLLFLPLAWFLNTRVLFPTRLREIEGGRAWIRDERAKLGPLNRGETATLVVFAFAVFFWVFRPLARRAVDRRRGAVREALRRRASRWRRRSRCS